MRYKIVKTIDKKPRLFAVLSALDEDVRMIGTVEVVSSGTVALCQNEEDGIYPICLGTEDAKRDAVYLAATLFGKGPYTPFDAQAKFEACSGKIYTIGARDGQQAVYGPTHDFSEVLAQTGAKGLVIWRFEGETQKIVRRWEMGEWRKIPKK